MIPVVLDYECQLTDGHMDGVIPLQTYYALDMVAQFQSIISISSRFQMIEMSQCGDWRTIWTKSNWLLSQQLLNYVDETEIQNNATVKTSRKATNDIVREFEWNLAISW